ncbi:hypothetical protein CJF30_00004885 [Rutstroemia sp. NJR-2017a BBW]|nr:hypothetical protein CJF30_00004885 [Rutstroemia sp. NJR-2017a BBW]
MRRQKHHLTIGTKVRIHRQPRNRHIQGDQLLNMDPLDDRSERVHDRITKPSIAWQPLQHDRIILSPVMLRWNIENRGSSKMNTMTLIRPTRSLRMLPCGGWQNHCRE